MRVMKCVLFILKARGLCKWQDAVFAHDLVLIAEIRQSFSLFAPHSLALSEIVVGEKSYYSASSPLGGQQVSRLIDMIYFSNLLILLFYKMPSFFFFNFIFFTALSSPLYCNLIHLSSTTQHFLVYLVHIKGKKISILACRKFVYL